LIKAGIKKKINEAKPEEEDYEVRKAHYKNMPELEKLITVCEGYMGLIFCNDKLSEIKDVLGNYRCNKGAKIGAVSPCEVTIQPGATGLDPKQTAFFQALNIQTKIVKTQIEIINSSKILSKGQKIGASECALLDKLGIRPFLFEVTATHVYDNGTLYSPDVLNIRKEDVIAKLRKGAGYLTAASLQSGYPTALSARQLVLTGFKNLVACTMSSPFTFNEAKAIKEASEKPKEEKPKDLEEEKPKKKVEKKEEEKKEEKKEEEAIGGFGDIFGGDA
jgi:large subunit ribosomal protein LP0